MWKLPFIRSIPKINRRLPPCIALTSILAKCMERVISYHPEPYVSDHLDILQFAYRPQRGTENATLTMVDTIASHLQQAKSNTRVLFIDYTSAFNTRQIHLLLERLLVLGVNRLIIHWIKNFWFSDYNKFASGGLNQILCFQIQEYLKDAFCHPYYFLYIQMRYKCRVQNRTFYKYAEDMASTDKCWENKIIDFKSPRTLNRNSVMWSTSGNCEGFWELWLVGK